MKNNFIKNDVDFMGMSFVYAMFLFIWVFALAGWFKGSLAVSGTGAVFFTQSIIYLSWFFTWPVVVFKMLKSLWTYEQ